MAPSKKSQHSPGASLVVGEWTVRPSLGELRRSDESVHLEPKTMAVLLHLAEHPRKVCSRESLIQAVWGEAFVTEEVLTHVIWELRRLLGDDAKQPKYIQTVPKRGYRLVADISRNDKPTPRETIARETAGLETDDAGSATSPPAEAFEPRSRRSAAWRLGVAGLVVVGAATALFWTTTRGSSPAPETRAITSLAVLPLDNLMNDPEQQYFVDGMHEALITDLSKIRTLKVISRTSTMRYRKTEKSIPEIAEELGVDALVEGSVLLAGNDVRISAQLIDGATDEHLWAESYTRPLEDVLALHDQISSAIADEIKVVSGTREPMPALRKESAQAYTLVLQGKYFEERRSEENLEKAKEYYQRALEIDPEYSLAWARLAGVLAEQTSFGFLPFDKGYELAREAATKALELNDRQAEAWNTLSEVRLKKDFDLAGADDAARHAVELSPGNAEILRMAAYVAMICGRLEEAAALNRRTIELDPLSARNYRSLAIRLRHLNRPEEAEAALKQALEFNPEQAMAHRSLGLLYLDQGEFEAALAEMARESFPKMRIQGLALAYHALGRHQEADETLAKLIEVGSDDMAYQIAEVYAYRGEADAAFQWLQRAYATRDPGVVETGTDLLFGNLHKDPRWPVFLEKLGLPGRTNGAP